MFPFDLFAARRRRRLKAELPHRDWDRVVRRAVHRYETLGPDEREKLQTDAAVIAGEKNFEGCGGFRVDDVSRLTVSAQIAYVALGFEGEYFDAVKSVLIYPDAFVAPDAVPLADDQIIAGDEERIGEASSGVVVLSWPEVVNAGRGPNRGRHVVAHELAHQLDIAAGGIADGQPSIADPDLRARWADVTEASFVRLEANCRRGGRGHLDCYGATDRVEFFAVATEEFFQRPGELRRSDRPLFDLLAEFYKRQPSSSGRVYGDAPATESSDAGGRELKK
ncbi:MAG: M90 family metallopeptidase [Planctomycetota bacterium]